MQDKLLAWSNKLAGTNQSEQVYCFLSLEPFDYQFLKTLNIPYKLTESYIIIPKQHTVALINKFLNAYEQVTKYKLNLLMYPHQFIETPLEILNLGTEPLELKRLSISRNDLNKGAIAGYFSYYAKKFKNKKSSRVRVLYERPAKTLEGEPFEQCYKDRYLVHGAFRSSYILGPQLTALKNKLCKQYKEKVLIDHQEITLAKYTTELHWSKTNHIRLPEHAYLIGKLKKQCIALKELYGHLYKKWHTDVKQIVLNGVGSYGVCEVFWSYLENQNKVAPFKYFDNSGFSLRNEGNAIKSLERLDAFSRIEGIFGYHSEQFLEQHIQKHVEKMKEFLNAYDLHYRVLEVQSWTPVQSGQDSCKVKTIDFEVYLSYKNDWLEIGNISNNGYNFSKPFNVRFQNKHLVTGCSALGIERILFAVIHQKGYKHIQESNYL